MQRAERKRAIMMLPYLSLVSERSADLAAKLSPAKVTVKVHDLSDACED